MRSKDKEIEALVVLKACKANLACLDKEEHKEFKDLLVNKESKVILVFKDLLEKMDIEVHKE